MAERGAAPDRRSAGILSGRCRRALRVARLQARHDPGVHRMATGPRGRGALRVGGVARARPKRGNPRVSRGFRHSPVRAILHRAGTRTAIYADLGDAGRGDLDPRRHVSALEQLAKHRLAPRLDSRAERLLTRLGSQRLRDLNVYVLFDAAMLDLPAVDIADTRSLDRSRPSDDPGILGHLSSIPGAARRHNGPLAHGFGLTLDSCVGPAEGGRAHAFRRRSSTRTTADLGGEALQSYGSSVRSDQCSFGRFRGRCPVAPSASPRTHTRSGTERPRRP
jgi:hypothetical protein